ncbi:hypothetical protein L596_015801 [Steinernema carpocapsae]|uniref:Uncharacterized protein n=1 Tax=Steinernema carpocapsae TaxID=34508 RepID=A0A4U5NG78_STECR|nr:hypothetical protein L596_015801 [Steinernema carpocapsae]
MGLPDLFFRSCFMTPNGVHARPPLISPNWTSSSFVLFRRDPCCKRGRHSGRAADSPGRPRDFESGLQPLLGPQRIINGDSMRSGGENCRSGSVEPGEVKEFTAELDGRSLVLASVPDWKRQEVVLGKAIKSEVKNITGFHVSLNQFFEHAKTDLKRSLTF